LICFFGMLTAQGGDCAIYHGDGLLSAFQFPSQRSSSFAWNVSLILLWLQP